MGALTIPAQSIQFALSRSLAAIATIVFALLFAATAFAQDASLGDDRNDPVVKLMGMSGVKRADPQIRIAELFLQVRDGKIDGVEFFTRLADVPGGMKEVREVRTAIQKAGLADAFLGSKYGGGGTIVEKTVLEHRRRVTERLIQETVRSTSVNSSVFVAKVGKWATQAAEAMTFDGDIDFSFIAADMRDAKRLKDRFDALLRDELKMAAEARGADVVATAHGQGDAEVYIGDDGQGFAEQALEEAERKARADGKRPVLVELADSGDLKPTDMAAMRATISLQRGLIAERSARLPDIRAPSDPGLSMEMVRHLLHDIKGSKEYPPGVLIVKASKYLQRSDQSAAEGGFKATNDLSAGADEIVSFSKDPNAARLGNYLVEKFGTNGVVDDAASNAYVDAVERGIWRNVELSIHAKADALEKRVAEAERATGAEREAMLDQLKNDTLQLHDTLAAERKMLAGAHIDPPATIEAQISRVSKVVETLKKLGRPISDAEMRRKRFVEEMQKSRQPTAIELARAAIYKVADEGLEKFNEKLDFIDNYVLSEVRGDRNFDAFLQEMETTKKLLASTDPKTLEGARARVDGLRQQVKFGIAETNRRLNEAIQRSAAGRGAMRGMMVMGLAEEIPAYVDAMWTGDWNGLATEFFRHRVPMFSAVERVAVDGNPSDYAMAAWDLVTTLVPAIQLGQAAVGIAKDLGAAGVDLYWDDKLQVFVDEAYAGARFTPVTKTMEGDAWFAAWRLDSIAYRDNLYPMKDFAKMRREDVKALAAELKKPRKARDLDKPMYGRETGLIDRGSVDQILRRNLLASDSQLRFLEELSGHPLVGPLLKSQYEDQKRVRWEGVKLAFLVELVDRLETRWARDWAAKSGQLPELQKELTRITRQLDISAEVEQALEAAKPGRISLLAAWLHAQERDLFLQPDAVGAVEEEVGRIQDAITAYRAILDARGSLEARLGAVGARDGGLRLLTGPAQLRGLPATDRAAAAEWNATIDRLSQKAAEELRGVKVRMIGGSIDRTSLDPGFDQEMLKRLSAVDVWRYAWAKIQAAGESVKRPAGLDDPPAAVERLRLARQAILDAFADHYRGAGVLEAAIVDATTGAALDGAVASLGAATVAADSQGRAIFTGIQPGVYDLSATAVGHETGKIEKLAYPVAPAEGVGNRRSVRLALAPAKVEPRRSSLTVHVADAGDRMPIAGALVTLGGASAGAGISRATNESGDARFDDLAPGDWVADAQARDHEAARSATFALPVGKSGPSVLSVSIAMKPTVPPKKTDDTKPATDQGKIAQQATPPTADAQNRQGQPPQTQGLQQQTAQQPNAQSNNDRPPVTRTDKDPGAKNDKVDAAIADYPLGTWDQALTARNEYRSIAQRAENSDKTRASAREKLGAADKRMQDIWQRDREVAVGLPAFVQKYIDEVKRIYAEFAKTAPAKPTGERPSGNVVTDLEGNDAWSRYACVTRMDQERSTRLASLEAFLAKAKAAETAFAAAYDGADKATAAVRAYDALWPATDISADWRAKGAETSIRNPCQDNAKPVTLKLPPGGPAPSAPPAAATPDQPVAPRVTLALDPAAARKGEIAVVASAAGGKPPFNYQWTGALRAAGERAVYAAPVGAGAKARAVVKATDAAGATATAELALEPAKVEVFLTRSDGGASVRVGQKVSFSARVTVDGKPTDAAGFVLRWEPSSEAKFERAEGDGVAANAATFARIGKAKVWVVALQRVGATLATAAESAQIEIDVVGAEISLQANPSTPRVGQEVKVTASEQPPVSDKDASYWWENKGQASSAGATANPRVFSFIPKDTGPVVVTAHLKAKARGEELAAKSLTLQAEAYAVSIVSLGPAWENATSRPVVWRPGQGLVTLDKEIAAHQDVGLRADIAPQPATAQLRYRWSVGPGGVVTGNPAARETRVQGASVGALEAKVEVRDANDIVLGSASTSISISVSDSDIATGKAKAAEFARLKEESAKAWADGDADAACDKGKAAHEIDPKFTEAQTYCSGRDRIVALAKEVASALASGPTKANLDRAQTALDQVRAVNPKARALAELARRIAEARQASEKAEADRQKRLSDLHAGVDACGQKDWAGCKARLEPALAGVDKVLKPEDRPTLDQARNLLAQANQALSAAKAGQQTGAKPDNAKGATQFAMDPTNEAEGKCANLAALAVKRQGDGDQAGAIPLYQLTLSACPKYCPVMANLSAAYNATGDVASARKWAAEAVRCDPGNDSFKHHAAALDAAQTGAPSNAATPASDRDNQCVALASSALAKQRAGDDRAAIPIYENAIALCPKLCTAAANLAAAYHRLEQHGPAAHWAHVAVQCDPANEAYRTNEAAITSAQKGAAAPPPPPPQDKNKECRDVATVGIGKQSAGDHRGAIPLYQEALELCPALCPVMANLGLAYNATGNPVAARRWVEAATRCDPANDNYKRNLAAIVASQQANAHPPPPPSPPPPPPPAANFDGVYQYTANDTTITFEVRGRRIYNYWSTDPEHKKFEAPVNANGEFQVHFTLTGKLWELSETTIDGRVANGQITGKTRFRYKNNASSPNWSGNFSKDFVARRVR